MLLATGTSYGALCEDFMGDVEIITTIQELNIVMARFYTTSESVQLLSGITIIIGIESRGASGTGAPL